MLETRVNIKKDIKCIGLQLSGGADSALMAYLVSKYIIDNNLSTKLKRITFGFGNKPDYFQTAENIQNKITEMLGKDVWIEPYIKFYNHKQEHSTVVQLRYLFNNNIIDFTMSGRTKNPSINEVVDPSNSRIVDRDNPVIIDDDSILEPFYDITKDVLLQYYFDNNLESLLFITSSCDANYSPNLVVPCTTCWWCREREWAFKKIGKHDVNTSTK